jgi:hypothetical protein
MKTILKVLTFGAAWLRHPIQEWRWRRVRLSDDE